MTIQIWRVEQLQVTIAAAAARHSVARLVTRVTVTVALSQVTVWLCGTVESFQRRLSFVFSVIDNIDNDRPTDCD
jgi:hypothetical protein